MAKRNETKRGGKSGAKRTANAKRKSQRTASKNGAAAVQNRPARKAFGYGDRVPPIETALKSLGGSASIAELFEELATDSDGQFATPRRVAAAVRAQRGDSATLENVAGVVKLIKRQRTARKSDRVSRKRTRSSK